MEGVPHALYKQHSGHNTTAVLPAPCCPSRTHRLPPCTSSQSGTRRASVAGERTQARQIRRGRGWSVGAALARDSCPHPQLAASWRRRLRNLPRTSPRGRRRETVTTKPSRQYFTLFCQRCHVLFCVGLSRQRLVLFYYCSFYFIIVRFYFVIVVMFCLATRLSP